MPILIVVNRPEHWPLQVEGVRVVSARSYLTQSEFSELRRARVFNLCQDYAYQSLGYYVSLLAEARGHRPMPDVLALQDMKTSSVRSVLADDLDELIQTSLRTVPREHFTLSIYFGKTMAQRDRVLGLRLFGSFRAPLLRAEFAYKKRWVLQRVVAIPAREIPDSHRSAVVQAATDHFSRGLRSPRHRKPPRYHLAILHDPAEKAPPSNTRALDRLMRAARRASMHAELVTRDTLGSVGEYDALFIRTTTAVNHYTFRLARRAEAEGVAVIDDPGSIIRCTNKVYLAELLGQRKVAIPRTAIVHRDNIEAVLGELGLPLVLKQPDSQFSLGVVKVPDADSYRLRIAELLDHSDMVVAQAFMPTDFDWRVGTLDGQVLYVCKYHMARNHWQIMDHEAGKETRYGRVESLAPEAVPKKVLTTALRAARLIGDGLYGVDLKQVGNRIYVIEVNDNPNIDAGFEDKVLGSELYDRLVAAFIRRIDKLRNGSGKSLLTPAAPVRKTPRKRTKKSATDDLTVEADR